METVKFKYVKTDAKIIKKIASAQHIPVKAVEEMMQSNVFTVNQLATLSGTTVNDINNKCKPGRSKPSELTCCSLFPEWKDGKLISGRVFVLRNEEAEALLNQ